MPELQFVAYKSYLLLSAFDHAQFNSNNNYTDQYIV